MGNFCSTSIERRIISAACWVICHGLWGHPSTLITRPSTDFDFAAAGAIGWPRERVGALNAPLSCLIPGGITAGAPKADGCHAAIGAQLYREYGPWIALKIGRDLEGSVGADG
jgi:hypothetical protein